MQSWKPGSEPERAGEVEAKGDFGAPANDAQRGERDYVSRNTKRSDRGAAQPASREFDGVRTSGAGGNASGTGSSSGGDIDTDIVGVGFGGSGISQSGPDDTIGADETDGTSNEFSSPPPKSRPR